jgi:hypothetical protein
MGISIDPPRVPRTKPPSSDASIMLGIVGAALAAALSISFLVWLCQGAHT